MKSQLEQDKHDTEPHYEEELQSLMDWRARTNRRHEEPLYDTVNHPKHYTKNGIECIDIIDVMTNDKQGMEAVCVANIVKYLYRYKDKGGIESVKKAKWYLEKLIKEVDNE